MTHDFQSRARRDVIPVGDGARVRPQRLVPSPCTSWGCPLAAPSPSLLSSRSPSAGATSTWPRRSVSRSGGEEHACPTNWGSISAPRSPRPPSPGTGGCRPSTSAPAPRQCVLGRADPRNGDVLVGEAAASRALVEPARAAGSSSGDWATRRQSTSGERHIGPRCSPASCSAPSTNASSIGWANNPTGWCSRIRRRTRLRSWSSSAAAAPVPASARSSCSASPPPAPCTTPRSSRCRLRAALAVYDFGGGTFEAAVVRRDTSRFELVGTAQGIARLGGIEFDLAVLGHVDDELGGRLSDLDPNDPQSLSTVGRARMQPHRQGAAEPRRRDRDPNHGRRHDLPRHPHPGAAGGADPLLRVIETVDRVATRRGLGRLDHGGHRPRAAGRRNSRIRSS